MIITPPIEHVVITTIQNHIIITQQNHIKITPPNHIKITTILNHNNSNMPINGSTQTPKGIRCQHIHCLIVMFYNILNLMLHVNTENLGTLKIYTACEKLLFLF